MLKEIGTGAVLLATVAASGAVLAAKDAPAPRTGTVASVARLAAGKPFAPICKSGEVIDSRPDPAWVGASFAHDSCQAPAAPAPINGTTASRKQIVAGMAAVKRYAALSDGFQRCVSDFVAARKMQADKEKKSMDATLVIIENHRIIASERSKKTVADQVKVAINSFNEYGSDCPGQ
jgi:hypothetical protein